MSQTSDNDAPENGASPKPGANAGAEAAEVPAASGEATDATREVLSEDEQRYREVLSFLGPDVQAPGGVPRDYRPQEHSIHPLFRVTINDYAGPLDLLVYLIRKHDIDVFDIPIRFLTERYLEMLDVLRALDIDVAAEFLVLAADLTHIKSKMLLPAKEGTPVDEAPEDEGDPREDLIRRLLEYQKYRDAAEALGDRDQLNRDVFARQPPALEDNDQLDPGLKSISIFKLVELMAGMMKKKPVRHEISYDSFNIAERMHFVLRFGNAQGGRFALIDLMEQVTSRAELVVTFIAVLESTKLQLVRLLVDDTAPVRKSLWSQDAETAASSAEAPTADLPSGDASHGLPPAEAPAADLPSGDASRGLPPAEAPAADLPSGDASHGLPPAEAPADLAATEAATADLATEATEEPVSPDDSETETMDLRSVDVAPQDQQTEEATDAPGEAVEASDGAPSDPTVDVWAAAARRRVNPAFAGPEETETIDIREVPAPPSRAAAAPVPVAPAEPNADAEASGPNADAEASGPNADAEASGPNADGAKPEVSTEGAEPEVSTEGAEPEAVAADLEASADAPADAQAVAAASDAVAATPGPEASADAPADAQAVAAAAAAGPELEASARAPADSEGPEPEASCAEPEASADAPADAQAVAAASDAVAATPGPEASADAPADAQAVAAAVAAGPEPEASARAPADVEGPEPEASRAEPEASADAPADADSVTAEPAPADADAVAEPAAPADADAVAEPAAPPVDGQMGVSAAETEALIREVAAIEREMAAQKAEEEALAERRAAAAAPLPWAEDEPLPTIYVELTGKRFEGDIMDDYA